MRRTSNGKVRRSRAEWAQLLERFETSGKSAAAFCREHSLSKSSFERWRKILGRDGRRAAPKFIELSASTASPSVSSDDALSSGAFELSLPGGVVLRWKA